MADSIFDLDPVEQRLRIAASILEDGQEAAEQAYLHLLHTLADPLDLAPGDHFLRAHHTAAFRARTEDLARRAARAGLAVLLADEDIELPRYIDIAFDMPASPDGDLSALARELREAVKRCGERIAALDEEIAFCKQQRASDKPSEGA